MESYGISIISKEIIDFHPSHMKACGRDAQIVNFERNVTFSHPILAPSVSVHRCTLTDGATGGTVRKCASVHTYGRSQNWMRKSDVPLKIHDLGVPATGLHMARVEINDFLRND